MANSLVESLAALVESGGFGFTRATGNLILNEPLPSSPNRACRIMIYSSLMPRLVHETSGPAYMYPRAQMMVRGAPNDAVGPEQDAYDLYFHISSIRDTIIENNRIVNIDALDYPTPFEVDGEQRRIYIFNIQIDEARQ